MKKLLLLTSLFIVFFACKENEQTKEIEETASSENLQAFYIEINANAEEDLAETDFSELVLSYEGKLNHKKLVSEFKENKAVFEGVASPYDELYIEYKYNVDNILYLRTGIPLIIEDTIFVDYDFSIKEVDLGDEIDLVPQFNNQVITSGQINKINKGLWAKLHKDLESLTYSWDILDSLNQTVFSERRAKLFENYEKHIKESEHEILKAKYFSSLVNSTEFDKIEWLTTDDLERLNLLFNDIDTSLSENPSYKSAKNKLYSYTLEEGELFDFKNFETKDIQGENAMVSDYFVEDKINIIYYWTSWCWHCHRFIQDFKDNYSKYEANTEYNIVFVNMDREFIHWERTSNDYQINWPNVHIGYDEDLMRYYQFTGFPSKFAYGENNEALEFDFKVIEDLLKS